MAEGYQRVFMKPIISSIFYSSNLLNINVYTAPANPRIEIIGSHKDVSLMKKYAVPATIEIVITANIVPADVVPSLFFKYWTISETAAPMTIEDVISILFLKFMN